MAALFWLILAQPVVLVLANTTDTYTNDTFLVVDEEYDDDHDYSLIPDAEEDTETSTAGDYFEDLIIAQLDSVDQTYDPFPIILTFNKPVIINIFLIFYCFKVPQDLDKARQIAFARVFQNWQVSSCNDEVISSVNHSVESQITPLVIDSVVWIVWLHLAPASLSEICSLNIWGGLVLTIFHKIFIATPLSCRTINASCLSQKSQTAVPSPTAVGAKSKSRDFLVV